MADLLQGVKEGVAAGSGDGIEDFKMPSTEDLLAAINQMSGLTEDMKKELLDGILAREEGIDPLTPGVGALPSEAIAKSGSLEIVWVLSLFSLVFLVLGCEKSKEITDVSETIDKYFGQYENDQIIEDFVKDLEEQIRENLRDLMVYVCVVFCIMSALFCTAVFFGYKLYKSLVERERRREEKKRQKLQKKKK